jgi:trimeric autotransporter adhesin
MKFRCFFLLSFIISFQLLAQVNTLLPSNGSITISPKGLVDNRLNANANYIAIGDSVLRFNSSGVGNIGLGSQSLKKNINGNNNLSIGDFSLTNNKSGSYNMAIGINALNSYDASNTSFQVFSDLIAIGYNSSKNSLSGSYSNITIGNYAFETATGGISNITLGHSALARAFNTNYNVAIGNAALNSLQSNIGAMFTHNVAVGDVALPQLRNGSFNTGVGVAAGNSLILGDKNTFVGNSSGVTGVATGVLVNNSMALGNDAKVNVSNKVVIGNGDVTQIGGYADWTNYSDRRLKENIIYTDNLGLAFINSLETASYTYKTDSNKRRRDGLIAQDVQKALKELGLEFSGLHQDNDIDKTLNLSYSELVLPLINAVKELSGQNKYLKSELESMKKDLIKIQALLSIQSETSEKTEK